MLIPSPQYGVGSVAHCNVPIEEIEVGDAVLIRAGEGVPTNGTMDSGPIQIRPIFS